MHRFYAIFLIFVIIAGKGAFSQVPDFCLTKDEYRLYTLINDYRAKKGLNIIPVSSSLCYVAKIHARDLYINNPDTSFCSLNSWSDKGQWTACCHSSYTPNPNCIVNKPTELANYPGEGHELAYWDSEGLIPDTVLHFWKSIGQASDLVLNQNKWSDFNWKAIGIGLYKGYACLWVGEVTDTIPEPRICSGGPETDTLKFPGIEVEKMVISSPTGRSYIIFGSFNSIEDAEKMVMNYRKKGFNQARILVNDKSFRVSLADYPNQQEAMDAKKELGMEFKDAWITKY